MSDYAPPPQQPPDEHDPAHDTIQIDDPPPRSANARGPMAALVIGTAMALIVGGGAYAFYRIDPLHFFRAGPQAAEAVPADALAYAAVDLDPAATQKINALRFLDHFPGFADVAEIKDERDDIRKSIFTDAIDSLDCPGVSYGDTVEPWLGNKFGFAAMPGDDGGDPEPLVVIETTDTGRAGDAFDTLQACAKDSGSNDEFGFAFSGDYALLASSGDLAQTYADEADKASLADDADFNADMDALGDLGVATAWVDIARLIDTYRSNLFESGLPGSAADPGGVIDLLKAQSQRAAATFRFSSDHADVVTAVRGDFPHSDYGDNEIVSLPDSTVFALSVSGGGDALAASWDDIMAAQRQLNANVDEEIRSFERQTGLNVPDDLETLLGENLMIALDRDGLSAATLTSGDPSQLNAGIRFTGDGPKLHDLYDRIMGLLEGSVGTELPFSKQDFDDGLAIATNDSYAGKLADLDGDLGDSQNFQSVVDDAAHKQFVLFFNWDLVEDQILANVPDGYVSSELPSGEPDPDQSIAANLRPLRAFGLSGGVEGDYNVSTLTISVD
jgi:hypothetical protein